MKITKIILFLLMTISIACENKPKYESITLIDSKEMLTLMQNQDVQLVDVRTVREFNEHYIKGAENIVFDENFEEKLKDLNKDKPIIVYCKIGGRSARCADILAKKGFKKIYDLKGGISQWMKDRNEVQ